MPFLTTALAALIGGFLFEALRIPAGSLIGATVAVALVNVAPPAIAELPEPVRFLAFVAIGWLIGQDVTREVVHTLWRAAPAIMASVAVLLAIGGAIAWSLVRLGIFDPATAFLATSPGGLTQMAALGAAVGANASVVVTLHMVRVLAVVGLAPFVVRWLSEGQT